MFFLILQSSGFGRGRGQVALILFLLSFGCLCSVSLSRDAVDCSVIVEFSGHLVFD